VSRLFLYTCAALGAPVLLVLAAWLLFVVFAFVMSGPRVLWLLSPPWVWLRKDVRDMRSPFCGLNQCKACGGERDFRAWAFAMPWWRWHLRPWGPCGRIWRQRVASMRAEARAEVLK
jgi:hypothetical protein